MDLIAKFGFGAVGALLLLLIGNRLRHSFDSYGKRGRFRGYVDGLRKRVAARGHPDFVFGHEHRETTKLEAEALEVRHHIVKRLRTRFDDALAAYKAVGFDTWAGPDPKRQEARDTKNEKAHQTLISSLDELYECAKWVA